MPGGFEKWAAIEPHKAMAIARLQVEENPTEAQAAAGNYRKGRARIQGMSIVLENAKGGKRRGVGSDGKAWERTLTHDYGYFAGTEGADGDCIDVFIGPDPESKKVWVIDQVNKDGSFDEVKTLVGFHTKKEAVEGYLSNYPVGWKVGKVTSCSIAELKEWMFSDQADKAFRGSFAKKVKSARDLFSAWAEEIVSHVKVAGLRRPENYDEIKDFANHGKHVHFFAGQNDWEEAYTWIWAEYSAGGGDGSKKRIWFEVSYPPGEHPGDDEVPKAVQDTNKKRAEGLIDKWIAAAKDAAGDDEFGSKFLDALPKVLAGSMAPDVEEHGIQDQVWKDKTAAHPHARNTCPGCGTQTKVCADREEKTADFCPTCKPMNKTAAQESPLHTIDRWFANFTGPQMNPLADRPVHPAAPAPVPVVQPQTGPSRAEMLALITRQQRSTVPSRSTAIQAAPAASPTPPAPVSAAPLLKSSGAIPPPPVPHPINTRPQTGFGSWGSPPASATQPQAPEQPWLQRTGGIRGVVQGTADTTGDFGSWFIPGMLPAGLAAHGANQLGNAWMNRGYAWTGNPADKMRYRYDDVSLNADNVRDAYKDTPYLGKFLSVPGNPVAGGVAGVGNVLNAGWRAWDKLNGNHVEKAAHAHTRNTCPGCGDVRQCRCPGPREETTEICDKCQTKEANFKLPPRPDGDGWFQFRNAAGAPVNSANLWEAGGGLAGRLGTLGGYLDPERMGGWLGDAAGLPAAAANGFGTFGKRLWDNRNYLWSGNPALAARPQPPSLQPAGGSWQNDFTDSWHQRWGNGPVSRFGAGLTAPLASRFLEWYAN